MKTKRKDGEPMDNPVLVVILWLIAAWLCVQPVAVLLALLLLGGMGVMRAALMAFSRWAKKR